MPRRYTSTDNIISALVKGMIADGSYSPKTIAHTREHCQIVKRYIGDADLYGFTGQDVRRIAQDMAKDGLAVSTQKSYIFALKALLKHINNPAYGTRIIYQADTRPRVDWLTPEQARQVLESDLLTPIERLSVTLALCMGLRRVEIVRLKIGDINLAREYITVTGKGRAGGKLRLVPFHERFKPALSDYLNERAIICRTARNTPPDNLLIWMATDRTAHEYNAVKASGIDGLIRRASRLTGVHFSAHTLRRTFGRILWLSGVPVVTIARILGHSSTEQTLTYIGANLDDMAQAMHQIGGIL